MDLARIQSVLAQRGFDAWLFYEHHHRDHVQIDLAPLSCERADIMRELQESHNGS